MLYATYMLRIHEHVLLHGTRVDVNFRTDLVELGLPFMKYLLHLWEHWRSMVAWLQ